MKKSLNGKWYFKEVGTQYWYDAIVPGCNFLDLMSNGKIPDPFIGLNEAKVTWVGEKDWEYKKTFIIKEKALNYNDILLNCKMLDTICDVLINDKLLFKGNNCFKSYSYSIKDFVEIGENELRIIFHSPVNYVSKKYEQIPAPINSNGQNGIVHIRKPQCHFGWDWGPVLPCSGITRDIELEFVEDGRINYLSVTQNHSDTSTIRVNADLP